MNRTKEFLYIINSTHIPQQKTKALVHVNKHQLLKDALDQLYISDLSTNIYYTKLRKLEKELIIETIDKNCCNLQEEKVYAGIKEYQDYMTKILKLQWQRCYDKLLEKKKKQTTEREVYISDTDTTNKKQDYDQQTMLVQETESLKKRDVIYDHIEEQITELGQIMCDISMHIQAQGECLKRLDDMVIESDDYIKRSVFEIQRTWNAVSGRRNGMVKIFVIFISILFIAYLFKRLF